MTVRKILMIIVDGLGDLPIPSLDGQTPLEAAATPVLDAWVGQGQCGLVDPVEPGITVETHAGTGTLLGMRPEDAQSLARGPIEAAGAGLELLPGDIALRCNFASVVHDAGAFVVRDRRAGRILEGTAELATAVNALPSADGITTFLAPLSQHRAVLRLSGQGLSAAITDTDPGSAGPQSVQWSTPSDASVAAERTAAALNRFLRRSHTVLAEHPINQERARQGHPLASGLLTRGAGRVQSVESLVARLGLRGAVVAGDRTVLGLGTLLGFTPVVEPAFTALPDTDLDAKVQAASDALGTCDIVYLHAKGSDIEAHDQRPSGKRDYLERLDRALVAVDADELVVAVAADHTTDSNRGRHTSDPVPALIRVPGGRRDHITTFGERACMRGGLGRLRSSQFLRVLLSAAGRLPTGQHSPQESGGEDARDADREPDKLPIRED